MILACGQKVITFLVLYSLDKMVYGSDISWRVDTGIILLQVVSATDPINMDWTQFKNRFTIEYRVKKVDEVDTKDPGPVIFFYGTGLYDRSLTFLFWEGIILKEEKNLKQDSLN